MNIESERLSTFRNWPANATVNAQRIAKAGFYYTGRCLRVVCFSCECFIDDWQYGDQAMARHRDANPFCPFVLSPTLSGNIPLLPSSDQVTSQISQNLSNQIANSSTPNPPPTSTPNPTPNTNPNPTTTPNTTSPNTNPITLIATPTPNTSTPNPTPTRFLNPTVQNLLIRESVRLSTFENWPSHIPISPIILAQAGFYYLNIRDKVQCAFCEGILTQWESGDDPDIEHARHFPHCSFVKNYNACGNIKDSQSDWEFETHQAPKNPNYVTYDSRLNSFKHWPDSPITPEQLADAGLYYVGLIDEVRCFHCDGGLRNWLPDDDPWIEHARWFPRCYFIGLKKGKSFIKNAMKAKPPNPNMFVRDNDETNKENINKLMESEIVMEALEMGLNRDDIRRAIRNQLTRTGENFKYSLELIHAVLDNKGEPSSESEQELSSTEQPTNETEASSMSEPDKSSRNIPISESLHCIQNDTTSNREIQNLSNSLKNLSLESKEINDLEEENRKLKESRTCKICMDAEVGVVYVPCGHLVTCVNCAASVVFCPLCRIKIQSTVKTYLS